MNITIRQTTETAPPELSVDVHECTVFPPGTCFLNDRLARFIMPSQLLTFFVTPLLSPPFMCWRTEGMGIWRVNFHRHDVDGVIPPLTDHER